MHIIFLLFQKESFTGFLSPFNMKYNKKVISLLIRNQSEMTFILSYR